jgi:hypothetical protein
MKLRILALTLASACHTDAATSSQVSGETSYRDAATNHDGLPQAPATPASQDARVTVVVTGTAQLPHIDARCATDGGFEAHYAGSLAVDGAGYIAGIGNGTLVTPSGCTIDTITSAVVTGVDIHAELDVTAPNCTAYCAASARADAEARCGATALAAACRADAETSLAASCVATCTSESHAIAADATLGATALGSVDADQLTAGAIGDLTANLTFDHLE